jgi:hypothetical protein
LPSSFTRVLSSAWGCSPSPPVSVWGTVVWRLKLRGFSWEPGVDRFAPKGSSSVLGMETPDLPGVSPYDLKPGLPIPGRCSLLRPPIAAPSSTGLFARFPSTTPFGLALGADSPCADCRCAGTLGLAACGVFTRMIVTHVSIRTSDASSRPRERPSPAYGTLPYHAPLRKGGHPQLR